MNMGKIRKKMELIMKSICLNNNFISFNNRNKDQSRRKLYVLNKRFTLFFFSSDE